MTQIQIAEAFSRGDFESIYSYLTDNVQWTVVGEAVFEGKKAVVKNCMQVSGYFKSVTTDFKIIHTIASDNLVAISGTAEFIRDGKRVNFISACDVYAFNENNELITITSYCIPENKHES